ncbi:MAG TPA: hypothetical protein VK514_13200 [Candidatus Acidoferrum sp.]|nr:hypothetical protein [Candidatus Acidoferrum sp.]
MAKQGTITAPSGADENIKTLGNASPVRDTLAGILRAGLGIAVAVKEATINFVRRDVVIAGGTVISDNALPPANMTLMGTLTKDDPTKASSPWTFVEGAFDNYTAPINAILAEKKPSFSGEALVNKLDELFDDVEGNGIDESEQGALVFVNQTGGVIEIYGGTVAHAAAADIAAAVVEDAKFVQTLDAAGGAQFFE